MLCTVWSVDHIWCHCIVDYHMWWADHGVHNMLEAFLDNGISHVVWLPFHFNIVLKCVTCLDSRSASFKGPKSVGRGLQSILSLHMHSPINVVAEIQVIRNVHPWPEVQQCLPKFVSNVVLPSFISVCLCTRMPSTSVWLSICTCAVRDLYVDVNIPHTGTDPLRMHHMSESPN